ncbi:MAG: hypothetical protein JRI23_21900, partial [Deltaproteobacteria bacterium]|nr:hypothetical protein [Deltaproteobacteria bacterium]MBW2534608.1 hypothetical protein [Deltaproteobacteria bacterium]
ANGTYPIAVRSHGGDGTADQNPFIDSDPANGIDTDILAQWESWFTIMDQERITIFFVIYDDAALVWDTGDTVGAEEQAFIETLVDTFEHHEQLIWVVAENFPAALTAPRVAAIAGIIRAADDHDHVISVGRFDGSAFEFASDPNVDQLAFESTLTTASELHAQVLPVFAAAAGAYNLNLSGVDYGAGGDGYRRRMWAVATAGAYVMHAGQNILDTPVSDLEECGRLREFMERVDLSGMAPHDELAWGGTDYVLAVPGERYVGYAHHEPATDMGLSSLPARTWQLSWFDAATGTRAEETVTTSGGGDASFPKPTSIGEPAAFYLR